MRPSPSLSISLRTASKLGTANFDTCFPSAGFYADNLSIHIADQFFFSKDAAYQDAFRCHIHRNTVATKRDPPLLCACKGWIPDEANLVATVLVVENHQKISIRFLKRKIRSVSIDRNSYFLLTECLPRAPRQTVKQDRILRMPYRRIQLLSLRTDIQVAVVNFGNNGCILMS